MEDEGKTREHKKANGRSVQVNIPSESGVMGVLANHVPSIEQLKPGLIEIIEESGATKEFYCMLVPPQSS